MSRNKVSNNLDYMKQNSKPKIASKGPFSESERLPKYTPVKINQLYIYGQGNLSNIITLNNLYAIFSLFFDEATLKVLVQYINEYAFLYLGPGSEKPDARIWFLITVKEFRAYLEVSIWIGLYSEFDIKEF